MEIGTFHQLEKEQHYEVWERYKNLLRKCPQHDYPDQLQIQLFYNGWTNKTKSIFDVVVGGSIFSKIVQAVHTILENLNNTSCNLPSERSSITRASRLNEVEEVRVLKEQLNAITSTLNKFTIGNQPCIASKATIRQNLQYNKHGTNM